MTNNQNGSVLLGAIIALGILASFTSMWVSSKAVAQSHLKQEQAAEQGIQILEALVNYYVDRNPAESNRWPTDIDDLIDADYLPTGESIYGAAWSLSIEEDAAMLSLAVPAILDARVISAKLPNGSSEGTTVTATIKRPGDEAIHLELYALDGRRPLTGNLNMQDKGIENAGAITYE